MTQSYKYHDPRWFDSEEFREGFRRIVEADAAAPHRPAVTVMQNHDGSYNLPPGYWLDNMPDPEWTEKGSEELRRGLDEAKAREPEAFWWVP